MHTTAQAWLSLQCKMISGVSQGLVILGNQLSEPLAPSASWPVGKKQHPTLSAVAKAAVTSGQGVMQHNKGNKPPQTSKDFIASPIIIDNEIMGVVAIEINARKKSEHQSLMDTLQWGALWLTFILEEEKSSQKDRLVSLVELITTALQHQDLHSSTTAIVTELSKKLSCDRVSLGFLHGQKIKISAMSSSVRFDRKTQLVSDITSMMNEAISQDTLISLPSTYENQYQITLAHKKYQQQYGERVLATVPLADNGEIIGAINLERSSVLAFSYETVELIEHVAHFMGPLLALKCKNQKGVFAHFWSSGKSFLSKIVGSGHLKIKTGIIALLAAFVFFSQATSDYRISSQAQIEGMVQRAIVAPIDGYIETANFKAGDIVEKDQLIVRLLDKDLNLEKTRVSNKRQQLSKEYRTQMAKHDRTQISILDAKIQQTNAELSLIDEKLLHTEIRSPLSGMIVTGDLSQNLGSPVEKGQVLFEVTPLNDYRIILNVDETEITTVKKGQQGQLLLSALSDQYLSFFIEKVTPVAKAEDGKNYFRVEALLDNHSEKSLQQLRPGMQGIGKISIEPRKLIWIWTHKMTEWLSLWLWSWK